jgi:prepilin-type N-terminal cleavage/methylation domain-containing protein
MGQISKLMINRRKQPKAPERQQLCRAGFSLTEMVTVIAIISILAGVVVVAMSGSLFVSKETLAQHRLELLNRALYQFAQQNYDLVFTARPETSADELFVLRTIQFRDPNENKAKVGSPYVTPAYNPVATADETEFRLRWTGKLYELLRPGQPGLGLKMDFEGKDMTQPFQFPPNFQMAGR